MAIKAMVKWFVFRVLLLIVRFLIHSWQMSGVYIVFGYVAAGSHQYNSLYMLITTKDMLHFI